MKNIFLLAASVGFSAHRIAVFQTHTGHHNTVKSRREEVLVIWLPGSAIFSVQLLAVHHSERVISYWSLERMKRGICSWNCCRHHQSAEVETLSSGSCYLVSTLYLTQWVPERELSFEEAIIHISLLEAQLLLYRIILLRRVSQMLATLVMRMRPFNVFYLRLSRKYC
jgi:hypothetical protein